ncbi:MAG TPA: hypothetical protein VFA15_02180, partial [Nitrososphaera sp.]|nr:hypothetical protein [Nitrososphaera sp.]
NEEIEKLKQQLVSLATEEARLIVEKARAEAEAESAEIAKQADKSISSIKKNIDSTFDRAVSSIVKTIIAQPTPPVSKEPPQQEGGSRTTNAQPAPRIKRYTSDGKIVS